MLLLHYSHFFLPLPFPSGLRQTDLSGGVYRSFESLEMLCMSSGPLLLVVVSFLSSWGVNAGFPSKIYGVNLGSWSVSMFCLCSNVSLMVFLLRLVIEPWMLPNGNDGMIYVVLR